MFSKAAMLNSLLHQIRKKKKGYIFPKNIIPNNFTPLFNCFLKIRRHKYLDLSSKIIKYFPENHLEDIIDNISEVDCRLL